MFKSSIIGCFLALQVNAIHVNQVGYYPHAKKTAIIVDSTTEKFSIIDMETNETVFSGYSTPSGFDKNAGEYVSVIDFTAFNKEGIYRIVVGSDTSYRFSINTSCNRIPLNSLIKSYYFQRSGTPLSPEYVGQWYRDAGHLADSALAVYDLSRDSVFDVRGGWYDAGDFGKYVVNAGITCGTLLELFELCPKVFDDSSLNLPESGNSRSDLLDEIKYELDWLIRMQDTDGGVFFKVGPIQWYGSIMPSADRSKRYIIGKSTTSTLNFTAVMAMAGRIYPDYDSVFAHDCIQRAEKAWDWAVANPKVAYPKNTGGTGPYADGGDIAYKDEFLWALTELGISTKKAVYLDTLEKLIFTKSVSSYAWWQDVKNLSFFSLSIHKVLSDAANLYVETKIIEYADKILANIKNTPYMNPLRASDYTWGSSGTCGNFAAVLVFAHYLSSKQNYLDAIVLSTDYLFGRNPLGLSYVTGSGSKSPLNPHHRQSTADKIDGPISGFVVGGANSGDNGGDLPLTEVVNSGMPPAKCYSDDTESWASNENAINQNAPWALVLGYLEAGEPQNQSLILRNSAAKQFPEKWNVAIRKEHGGFSLLFENDNAATLEIIDMQGKCLLKRKINNGDHSMYLKTGTLQSGAFIVKLHGKKGAGYSRVYFLK
jgi:endoglucanase